MQFKWKEFAIMSRIWLHYSSVWLVTMERVSCCVGISGLRTMFCLVVVGWAAFGPFSL